MPPLNPLTFNEGLKSTATAHIKLMIINITDSSLGSNVEVDRVDLSVLVGGKQVDSFVYLDDKA